MKRKNLKSLTLNKSSISALSATISGGASGGYSCQADCTGSQNNSKCGISCTPALCKPKGDLEAPIN